VAVLRIYALGRLPGTANVEAVRNLYMHVLVGAFGDTGPDNREILLLGAAGCARIDERGRTRLEVRVAHEPAGQQGSMTLGTGYGLSHGFFPQSVLARLRRLVTASNVLRMQNSVNRWGACVLRIFNAMSGISEDIRLHSKYNRGTRRRAA
jgi:hypothetical protein